MIKLKKKYNVEFLGNEKRKIRSDVSPIGEYRYFLLNCLRRDVPRRIILKVLQDNDERFGDYTLARLNLYCSRMFKRTPIDKVSKSFKGIIVKSILFMMCLSFVPNHLEAQGVNYYNNTEKIESQPIFMKDDFYTNTNNLTLDQYFSYRMPINNAGYNLEKGKILSSLLGTQNSLNGANIQLYQQKTKETIFLLSKLLKQQEIFNRYNILQTKTNIAQ